MRVVMLTRATAREVALEGRRALPMQWHWDCGHLAISVATDDGDPAIIGIAAIKSQVDLARDDVPREFETWMTLPHREWWLLEDIVIFEQGIPGLADAAIVDDGLLDRVRCAWAQARKRAAIGGEP